MTDLAQFLLDRYDEDERRARDAAAVDGGDRMLAALPDALFDCLRVAFPARVLAECAAKRATVAMWQRLQSGDTTEFVIGGGFDPLVGGAFDALGIVMKHLAAPYSDHPDFDAAWATGGTP